MSDRFDRLRATSTLSGDGLARWRHAPLFIFGCGNIGSRFAREAVRAGASVVLFDFDHGELHNLAVQDGIRVGVPKAVSLAEECNRIAEGSARAVVGDLYHVGPRTLLNAGLFVDATDDPVATPYLTEVSNGLGIALLRLAIDGSGEREQGRVGISHGGAGHACSLCFWTPQDLLRTRVATPCPGQAAPGRPPTLAGGGIGMVVAGIGLIQAQRLLGGNDRDLALDREVRIDLSCAALVSLELTRSERCVSGHRPWAWTDTDATAAETTVAELFELARVALGPEVGQVALGDVSIEPFGHALRVAADCPCGRASGAVGTRFVTPAPCPCGQPTLWHPARNLQRIDAATAEELELLDRRVGALGLPDDGALLVAHGAGCPPRKLLLGQSSPTTRTSPRHAE